MQHHILLISNYNVYFLYSGIQLIRKKRTGEDRDVVGVTWLENKIYTISGESNIIRTFQDHEPFNEETTIEVEGLRNPFVMVSSKMNRAIFIGDMGDENYCVWAIQIPDGKTFRSKIDGRPCGLSITPTDHLLVTVHRDDMHYLMFVDIHTLPGELLMIIHMPTEILEVYHAVRTTNGNFIVGCVNTNFPDRQVISELSMDGTRINRTFDLQSIGSISLKTWSTAQVTIDEDGNIFVADSSDDGHRVFQLNSRLNRIEITLNHDRHQIDRPRRLCYVQEKHMLIVGQRSLPTGDGTICMFECWKN